MKMRKYISIIFGFLFLAGSQLTAQQVTFKLVVHESNPLNSISKINTSSIFLKKTTKWKTGEKIFAVDLVSSSQIRQNFTKVVHGRKVSSIKSYWQKQIFSGHKIPPVEKKSVQEVLSFVQNNTGAIGYVSSTASLPGNVKTIELEE